MSILSENVTLYLLYRYLKPQGSKFFFKLKHNISTEREWCYAFGPDVDLLEVKRDSTIVAYEVKGQQKNRPWPAEYEGLDQAMAYLQLPLILTNGKRLYEGGVIDKVYVVHCAPRANVFSETWLRIVSITPIGCIIVTGKGAVFNILEAKPNPVLNKEAKQHFLQNLNTLKPFNEDSRTFRSIKRQAEEYLARDKNIK